MSEFKVGDLVECIRCGGYSDLKEGKTYTIWQVDGSLLRVSDEQGQNYNGFEQNRFKPKLKVGDRVKTKSYSNEILTILELTAEIAFLENECGTICLRKIKDLEKVEEKKAPPKFTKVYVWDGNKKPEYPKIVYSDGELIGKRLSVFEYFEHCESFVPEIFENWEVIG